MSSKRRDTRSERLFAESAEILRRALLVARERLREEGRDVPAVLVPAGRAPAAEPERWRLLYSAFLERVTRRGWRRADGVEPALDAIASCLVPATHESFEVIVRDPRGADTGMRARFPADDAPRLVRLGTAAVLRGSFVTSTRARRLRFSVRPLEGDSAASRRVSWFARVDSAMCDLADLADAKLRDPPRVSADELRATTIAYVDPARIELSRCRS